MIVYTAHVEYGSAGSEVIGVYPSVSVARAACQQDASSRSAETLDWATVLTTQPANHVAAAPSGAYYQVLPHELDGLADHVSAAVASLTDRRAELLRLVATEPNLTVVTLLRVRVDEIEQALATLTRTPRQPHPPQVGDIVASGGYSEYVACADAHELPGQRRVYCTRDSGHTGCHVAGGGTSVTWPHLPVDSTTQDGGV